MTRGQKGRAIAKAELQIAAMLAAVMVFALVASPGYMFQSVSRWWGPFLGPAPVAGFVIGFAWMIRIYRSMGVPDQAAWRYRRHD